MTVTGIYISADKLVEERQLSGLKDFQECVGGNIEPIVLKDGSTMFANEDGRDRLPFNSIASDVCGLGGRVDLLLAGVCGDVVVVGPVGPGGEETSITNKARRWIERVAGEAI